MIHVSVTDARQFSLPLARWIAEVKPAIAGVSEVLPSDTPLPPVSEEEVRLALGDGLPDGTRFERRENGYVIVDPKGFYLSSTDDPVWFDDENEDDPDPPPAYFDTPEAAWPGLRRAEAVQQAIGDRRSELFRRLGIDRDRPAGEAD